MATTPPFDVSGACLDMKYNFDRKKVKYMQQKLESYFINLKNKFVVGVR